MATALKTKPGINGANVLSIPTEWDATWFRKFINNSLKGADVRNAQGLNGISVTGTIASPYATIAIGTGPITVNGTFTVVSSGGIIIDAPAGVQSNFITMQQTGQAAWEFFSAAGSDDLSLSNATVGIVVTFQSNGQVYFPNRVGVGSVTDSQFMVAYLTPGTAGGAGARVGYNNTSTNYWDADNQHFRNGQGTSDYLLITPSNGFSLYTLNSGAYSASFAGVTGMQYNNASTTAQTALDFNAPSSSLGAASARIRFDYAGNLNYVTKGSIQTHNFYTGGDSGVGTIRFAVDSSGIISLPTVPITGTATAGGGSAIPATTLGFIQVRINGTVRNIPFYA